MVIIILLLTTWTGGILHTCDFGICLITWPITFVLSVFSISYLLSFGIRKYIICFFVSILIVSAGAVSTFVHTIQESIEHSDTLKQEQRERKEKLQDLIIVDEVFHTKNDHSRTLTIRGKAKEEWYTDKKFEVRISASRYVLGEGYAYALPGEHEGRIPFKANIEYQLEGVVPDSHFFEGQDGSQLMVTTVLFGPDVEGEDKRYTHVIPRILDR